MKKTFIDPPSGWKYGFPRQLPDKVKRGEVKLRDWFIECGYPESEVDFALKYCRQWEQETQYEMHPDGVREVE